MDPEEQTIPLYNILYDSSGQLIITGDDNGLIKIWSAFNCQLLAQFRGHEDLIHALEVSPCN
jgi:bromodomain and WD repeat domain containing protein 1/3